MSLRELSLTLPTWRRCPKALRTVNGCNGLKKFWRRKVRIRLPFTQLIPLGQVASLAVTKDVEKLALSEPEIKAIMIPNETAGASI